MGKIFFLIVLVLILMPLKQDLPQVKTVSSVHKGHSIENILGTPGFPFPVRPGNIWVYRDADFYYDSLRISSDTITIYNKTFYQLVLNGMPGKVYVREDTSGFCEAYDPDYSDSLLLRYYKRNCQVGDVWTDHIPASDNWLITHTVNSVGAMMVDLLYVPIAKKISVKTDMAFMDSEEIWSDTIGLVYSNRSEEPAAWVVACRINGIIYGSASYLPTGIKQNISENRTFTLSQNYPNPFNPSTRISYTIPEQQRVTLKVYDVLGKEIAVLVDAVQQAGTHSIQFSGDKLPSGIYIYEFRTSLFHATRKMLLLK